MCCLTPSGLTHTYTHWENTAGGKVKGENTVRMNGKRRSQEQPLLVERGTHISGVLKYAQVVTLTCANEQRTPQMNSGIPFKGAVFRFTDSELLLGGVLGSAPATRLSTHWTLDSYSLPIHGPSYSGFRLADLQP